MAWEPLGSATPVDTAIRSATAEAGGVRLTVEVEENPLPAGATRWITTTLENVGPDPIHWWTDGCEIDVNVRATSPFRWAWGDAEPPARSEAGQIAVLKFKVWALDYASDGLDHPIELDVTPESLIVLGDVSCADLGIRHDLDAGGRVRERTRWEGLAAFDYGLPPSGPASIVATFGSWWREGEDPFAIGEGSREDVEVQLPIEVSDGRPSTFISPGQAVDVALRAPALQLLLERYPTVRDWIGPTIVKVEEGRWTIGLTGGDGRGVTVIVDPIAAVIVDVIETP